MDQWLKQLFAFSMEDKYLSAEMGLALFEISGKLATLSVLSDTEKEIFLSWYCLTRINQHYQLTPLEVAQKFQAENFDLNLTPVMDVFIKGDENGRIQSKTSGLFFASELNIASNQTVAGLFLQENQQLFATPALIKGKLVQAEQLTGQISQHNWPTKLFPEYFSGIDSFKQLVDLEDIILSTFAALDIEDINEMDITDSIAEREHPQTLFEKIKNSANNLPAGAESFFIDIFSALQVELNINPQDVKEPELIQEAVEDEQHTALMEQILGQFSDPIQKDFYKDFFLFVQEKGMDTKGKPQQQLAGDIGVLEKEWRSTPREALGGLTPGQYREEHPEVEQAAVKTVKRSEPKVGRNDPCPCGSGKKYKKCCGKNL